MFTYKKSCMILAVGLLMMIAPAAHAVDDIERLAVPTVTGIVSGYIYGLLAQRSLLALVLSNILMSRCKDRIFAHYDKNHNRHVPIPTGLSVACESKTGNDGVERSTYIVNVGDNANAGISKYQEMSDFDDLVTLAVMLMTLCSV